MPWKSLPLLGVLTALTSGCAAQEFTPGIPTVPAAYVAPSPAAGAFDSSLFAAFGSNELNALIATAERDSTDLASAIARVRGADARARQAGAAIMPQVDANLGGTHYAGGAHGNTASETDWSAVLSAGYEIDFWGKNRAARNAARELKYGTDADLATAKATILTAVASTYFQVQSLRERIDLARSTLEATQGTLSFVEARSDAGLIGPAELAAQRASVATARLVVPQLEQQESEALAALALLVGRAPEGFSIATRALDTLTEPTVAAGLPSELLTRRPDIQTAEHNLRAAHADWLAARAALLPSLSLTAGGGIANPAVQAAVITLAGTGYTLTAGATLVQTIFDNGRRRAVTQEAAAHEEELLAGYRGAVLSALVDVENALTGISHLDQQRQPQHENVVQSERAFEGAQLRYRAGAAEYLTLLESQRTLYAARDAECQYRLARLQGVLGLNKALGGGWQTAGVAPLARAVSP